MIAAVVGALIGYITNWLAIKMLFWPRKEHRVWGIRVPFTPGVFVRRRVEFGTSVGAMIEERFVNDEVVSDIVKAINGRIVSGEIAMTGAVYIVFKVIVAKIRTESFIKKARDSHVIAAAIEKAVWGMDVEEIESLLMSVVKNELSAITWFGAVLGGTIGFIGGGM